MNNKKHENVTNTQYQNLFKKFKKYWEVHGGLKQLCYSPYFHFAFVCTLVINYFGSHFFKWQQITLQVIPNLLGFTLAGYTILLSLGDRDFLSILFKDLPIEKNHHHKNNSYFDKFSTAFLHFILIQTFSLLLAIITKALKINFYFIGTLLLFYAVSLSIATAFAIYQTIELFKIYFIKTNKDNIDDR